MSDYRPTSASDLRPPPGPRGLPVVGVLPRLAGAAPLHIGLSRLSRPYGDICSLPLGGVRAVFIRHPDLIREAFECEDLSERPMATEGYLRGSAVPGLFFSSYTQRWFELNPFTRHQLMGAEHRAELSRAHFENTIDELIGRLGGMSDAGKPAPMGGLLFSSGFDLIFRSMFGADGSEDGEYRRWKDDLEEGIAQLDAGLSSRNPYYLFPNLGLLFWPTFRRSRRLRERRDHILGQLMDHVEQNRGVRPPQARACLADIMLDREASEGLTRPAAVALCLETLLNVTTISAVVSWTLLLLANRPVIQAAVQEELDSVVGRDTAPGEEHRALLPYTFACVAESMRYRTVVPFSIPHVAAEDTEVGGCLIEKGTQVFSNIYSVHHDERFWESPNEFIPERFLPRSDESSPAAPAFPAFMPFGVGIRRCVGDHFSMSAIWLYAARVLQALRFEPPDGRALSEAESNGSTVPPKPHTMNVVRRCP